MIQVRWLFIAIVIFFAGSTGFLVPKAPLQQVVSGFTPRTAQNWVGTPTSTRLAGTLLDAHPLINDAREIAVDGNAISALSGSIDLGTRSTGLVTRNRQPERFLERNERIDQMDAGELLPMLVDHDPVVRLAAFESFAELEYPGRSSIFVAALSDSIPRIRAIALTSLADPQDTSAWLYIEPGLADMEAEVRIAAIEALALLESEQAIHSLASLLYDQDKRVRFHALSAMGEIGGEYAVSYLLPLRFDLDENLRVNAESILRELGFDNSQ